MNEEKNILDNNICRIIKTFRGGYNKLSGDCRYTIYKIKIQRNSEQNSYLQKELKTLFS